MSHPRARADYLEYRRELEGIAAEYAARRATADDHALLERIMERMTAAHERGDFEEEAEIDVEFHNAIGECAHNIVLLHTLRSCYRLLSDGVFENRLIVFTMADAREKLSYFADIGALREVTAALRHDKTSLSLRVFAYVLA